MKSPTMPVFDVYTAKNCIRCGSPFKANKLIHGDDVCPTCYRMNSITFWLPRLQNLKFPVPKTIIINADVDLLPVLDDKMTKGTERFIGELIRAIDIVGLPAFLRTEMLSNKHDWENSCFIKNTNDLFSHIKNLVEMSFVATVDRMTDCNFWAVREFIETEKVFEYFDGKMPITKEIRAFVRDGKIECKHPYWVSDAFEGIDPKLLKQVQELNEQDELQTNKMIQYIANLFSGYWSIDLLKSKKGDWYCTDMAIGERSYHQKNCPNNKQD